MTRLIGIDPGRTAGWVCLDVDYGTGLTLDREQDLRPKTLRYVDRGTISVRSRTKARNTVDKQDEDYMDQWTDVLSDHDPRRFDPLVVVCEQPRDAKEKWTGKRGKRPSGTETMFRAGCYYGLIQAGVYAMRYGDCGFSTDFYSYSVAGWMQGRPRKMTDLLIRNAAKSIHGIPPWSEWPQPTKTEANDHQHMALGVLLWHLGRLVS